MANHDLAELKRDLLTRLGRGDEALDAAWSDYHRHPSAYTYDDLLNYVPKAQHKERHEQAIEAAMGAKRCFERAGLEGEWSKTVRQVRADHHRKSSFMPGFERLVEGVGPDDEPALLDRAKARWNAKERNAR